MNASVEESTEESFAHLQLATREHAVGADSAAKMSAALYAEPDFPPAELQQATENIIVRQSAIHGTGAFARRDLVKGQRVIEYVGEIISKAESVRRVAADNEFIFTLEGDVDLDGKVPWNPARFINHTCTPNCEAEVDGQTVWIIALRDIKAGEELSFNYGYDLENFHEHPCRCAAASCVGYMVAEEHFETVRQSPAVNSATAPAATRGTG